jgi:uncharacterized membrane protein
MELYAKFVIFPLIIIVITYFGVYKAWFKDAARKQYEWGFIPGPKSLAAYIICYRVFITVLWMFLIVMYILGMIGVFQ